jgi:GNAT superfamily N-acetyltransferase
VACEGDEIQGLFIGSIGTHYFGNSTHSSDKAIYVRPENRNGSIGLKLVKHYVELAKKIGVDDIRIGNTSGVEIKKVWKLYERIGFKLIGAEFSYEG